MVANFDQPAAPRSTCWHSIAGATVRVADMAVDGEPLSPAIGAHKIRRSSGNIAVEGRADRRETPRQLIAAGQAIADEEVDGGADLLIAGDMGIGNTTAAAVLVAALTERRAGRGGRLGEPASTTQGWARKTAAIRDALFRARARLPDPVALLRCCGGADLAAMAGFLAQAAVRRTPLLLDGMAVTAAALVAERAGPRGAAVVAGRVTSPPSRGTAGPGGVCS